jgi:hypothetical protein
MPDAPSTLRVNLLEVNARADTAQHVITGFSRAMPNLADLWQQITHSLSDIPILIAEIGRLGSELAIVRLDRANLAAAGRASLAAYRMGEPDPLLYLRDELGAQGFTAAQRGRP